MSPLDTILGDLMTVVGLVGLLLYVGFEIGRRSRR